ncbi:hypothetical protein OF83DRAFT_1071251, partial [Amylostereum chailletii]
VNRTGKLKSFTPYDQAQEQNIKDIKVSYRSIGPNATFSRLGRLSPGIPVWRAIAQHMKWQHRTIMSRGTRHTTPGKDKDVARQMQIAVDEKWLVEFDSRKVPTERDRVKDVMTEGVKELMNGGFARWWESRSFPRSTEEDWDHIDKTMPAPALAEG